jgi:hypothetical protein
MTIPMRVGLLCIGALSARMSRVPFRMPEVPKPAITRPTISIRELVASPQIKEPISKTKKKPRKVH